MRYARIMKRTTVMLPDDVEARLRLLARRRGVPLAEIVREAVVEYVADDPEPRSLSFIGVADGEAPNDASERVDELLGEIFEERHRRRS